MARRPLSVGIDIDGVLRNFGFQFARYAKDRYGLRVSEDDYTTWGFPNVRKPDGKKVIVDVFANPEVGRFVYEKAPPITNAYSGYWMFVTNPSLDTYIVSSQKKGYEQFSDNWLYDNGFLHHTDTFYERDKLKAPVQVLIDDKAETVVSYLQNQRDAILINQPYNQNLDIGMSVERADDLIDAYRLITTKYNQYL